MSDEPYGWKAYRTNLLLLYDTVKQTAPDARIEELAEETKVDAQQRDPDFAEMWGKLNEIEARLFLKFDDTRLRAETERKFVQAERLEVAGLDTVRERFRAIADDDPGATEKRRAEAMAILQDMFVRYSYRHAERAKRTEVATRLTWLGVGLLILPLVMLLYYSLRINGYFDWFSGATPAFGGAETTATGAIPGTALQGGQDAAPDVSVKPKIHEMFVVIYFGFVGAYFSRLSVFQRDMARLRWQEMDKGYGRGAMAVRLLVGSIGAAILYFLMMGDILSGALFPASGFDLFDSEGEQTFRPTKDFALLIVWSFVAGFSERFVPDRLGEVETRGKVKTPPPTG
jgi:hypothetical protein